MARKSSWKKFSALSPFIGYRRSSAIAVHRCAVHRCAFIGYRRFPCQKLTFFCYFCSLIQLVPPYRFGGHQALKTRSITEK
jgi:hypothetical protein